MLVCVLLSYENCSSFVLMFSLSWVAALPAILMMRFSNHPQRNSCVVSLTVLCVAGSPSDVYQQRLYFTVMRRSVVFIIRRAEMTRPTEHSKNLEYSCSALYSTIVTTNTMAADCRADVHGRLEFLGSYVRYTRPSELMTVIIRASVNCVS